DLDAHAARRKPLLLAGERLVLAHHDTRDAVEDDGATAHGAWRQGRVHRAFTIDGRGQTSRVLECVHLAVEYGAAALYAAIMAAADHAIAMDENGAYRDPTFVVSQFGLGDRCIEEGIHGHILPQLPARNAEQRYGPGLAPSRIAARLWQIAARGG